jgi:hypothetical protein
MVLHSLERTKVLKSLVVMNYGVHHELFNYEHELVTY